MSINELLPSDFMGTIKNYTNYSQISDNIFITDNEEIAIAIVDSIQNDSVVIFRNSADKYSVYSEKYLGEGNSDFAKSYIRKFLTS